MKKTKRTLAIVALAFSVGCTKQLTPATPAPKEAVILQIQSSNATKQLLELLVQGYQETFPNQVFETQTGNYGTMFQNLLNADSRYFLSQHLPADGETLFWAAPIAQDGLAMIVHPKNPIRNMSLEQVRSIYQGHLRNWGDIGGSDLDIILYSREEASGSRLEFERLVMGQFRSSPNAQILPSSVAMLEQIATEPSAIGYVPLSQVDEFVQTLSINGIEPSIESISNNSYPLRYTIFVVGLEEPETEYRDFFAWSQGIDAQSRLSGYFAPLPP
jgi:phosphate transport system substrate-binding protein